MTLSKNHFISQFPAPNGIGPPFLDVDTRFRRLPPPFDASLQLYPLLACIPATLLALQ